MNGTAAPSSLAISIFAGRPMNTTAANTANNDAPSFEKEYCCRSIVPLRVLVEKILLSSRHNSVVCRDVIRQAPKRKLEQAQVIFSTMKDAMHENRLSFNRVENEVVLNDEVAISQPQEFFFVGDSPKLWILGKQRQALFYL